MRKLGNRGSATVEFILVAVPLFTLMFVIFDLARYALTMQSLQTLADVGARTLMINCYNGQAISSSPNYSSCASSSYLPSTPTTLMQTLAPFVFHNGVSPPRLQLTAGANSLTVTATQSNFKMLVPLWGTTLNAPSASTTIPF
jgi:Flp pilus assembly protein TadG